MRGKAVEDDNLVKLKDKNIEDLSSQIKALTTLKTILESQIEDLKLEKVPLKNKIRNLEKEMSASSSEVAKQKEFVKSRELEIGQCKDKIHSQVKLVTRLEGSVRTLKRELILLAGITDEAEVKKSIDALYKKYTTLTKK